MKKQSLSERIEAYITKKGIEPNSNKNQLVFLQNVHEIREALLNGWKIKTIWEVLSEEKVFSGSYMSFVSYVRRHIGTRKFSLTTQLTKNIEYTKIVEVKPEKKENTVTVKRPMPNGFNHNLPLPKDEDLY